MPSLTRRQRKARKAKTKMDWLKKVKKLFGLRSSPSRRDQVKRTLSVNSANKKSINPTPQVCPSNEYPLPPGSYPSQGYPLVAQATYHPDGYPSYPQLHTSCPPPASSRVLPPPPLPCGVLPPPSGAYPPPSGAYPPPLLYPPQQNPPQSYGQPSNPSQPTNQGDAPDASVVIETLSAVKAEDVVGLESD